MTPTEFISKWRNVKLTERSASQQHFLDLCALLGHPTPAALDKTGESFTFELGAKKRADELVPTDNGWADVWKKGFFAWEYKGPHKDLGKAYRQLQQYREDLENPPLLVVSDMDRIVIHTNFTATPVEVRSLCCAQHKVRTFSPKANLAPCTERSSRRVGEGGRCGYKRRRK